MGRRRGITYRQKRALAGWLFSIPFLVGFFLFFLIPVLQSLVMGFQTVKASPTGIKLTFIGLENFKQLLLVDPDFIPVLVSSLTDLAIDFPAIILFSFFIASLLNQKFRGRTLSRVIFFLPVVISSGVIQLIQSSQLQAVSATSITAEAQNTGVVQLADFALGLIRTVRIDPVILDYVQMAVDRAYGITVASGIQILIFLAGLQGIHPALFEASSLEGATGWENFWKITFPMISPLILVNSVFTIIDSMGGLLNQTIMRIHTTSFIIGNYGYASAMSWTYFLIIFIVLSIFLYLTSRKVYYEN